MADRGTRRQSLSAIAAAALCAFGPAFASPCAGIPLEGVAGWEGDRHAQGYGFLTVGVAPPAEARWSFPVRVTGSYLYYDYEASGGELHVRAPGVGGMLGARASGSRGGVALLAGGECRWERRSSEITPAAAAATVARGGAVAQGEAALSIGRRLRPFLLANYSGAARYVYGRAEVPWQCTNLDWSGPVAWFVGIEGAAQGNDDTDAVQGGASVSCSFTRSRFSLGLHGGYKESRSAEGKRRSGPYLGATFYRRF